MRRGDGPAIVIEPRNEVSGAFTGTSFVGFRIDDGLRIGAGVP